MVARTESAEKTGNEVGIEVAINRAGFGLYSYLLTGFSSCAIIAFACISYNGTIIVPTSTCELGTTPSQQGLLVAAPVIGSILGTVLWGYLADNRGRRKMLLVALLCASIINSLASFSVNWIMLMCFNFLGTFFVSGIYSIAMAITCECVPMAKRNQVVLLVTSVLLISQGLIALIAIPIIPLSFSYYMPAIGIYWNSWRTLIVVYSVPSLISACWIYFMKESPKFVFENGDADQALEILRTIYRVNNIRSNKELDVTKIIREESATESKKPVEGGQITELFKAPYLKHTLIMCTLFLFQQKAAFLVWLPTIANQFVRILESGESAGLTLCGMLGIEVDIPNDPDANPCALDVSALLIVLGVGALQSGINLLLSLIVNRVGRRNLVMIITATSGMSGILVNLIPNVAGSVTFFVLQMMGVVVMGMYTAIIVTLYPTHLRAVAIAIPMTASRIGGFASIQIVNILLINNCEVAFFLYASIFASSAIVASFLPDDRLLKPAPREPALEENNEEKVVSTKEHITPKEIKSLF